MQALERIATGRGVVLNDELLDYPLENIWIDALLRHEAAGLFRATVDLFATVTPEEGVDLTPTAAAADVARRLNLIRATAARVDLNSLTAAAGYFLGTSLSLLFHDLLDGMSENSRRLERRTHEVRAELIAHLEQRLESQLKKKANAASLRTRTQDSDGELAVFEWLVAEGSFKRERIYLRLARQAGSRVPALKKRLIAARKRRRQRQGP